MRRKILHVINSMASGGAETLLKHSLTAGGLQDHTDNSIAYFGGASGLLQGIDKDVNIHNLGYKGLISLPSTLSKLRRIIQQHDLVHSHLNPAGFYTHIACPGHTPQVHTVHTTYSMDTETRPSMRYLERKLYLTKKHTNVILLSEFTKQDFLRSLPFRGSAFVLNNFVPDVFFKTGGHTNGNTVLKMLAVGTLKELKNFEYLLEVFKYLKEEPIELDIYGSGDKSRYEQVIARDGLKIRMMGPVNDLPGLISNYDLFIHPSKFEGFPLAVFEAMAAGVPLLLSDIAPVKAVVGNHALYFKLDDAVTTAEIIRSLVQKRDELAVMSTQAGIYAEKTVRREIYINKLLGIYEQLITRGE